jgi:hypothetical protein
LKNGICIIMAAIIGVVGWTGSARTTSMEIPLPELSGSYNPATRQITFRFDRLPIQIYGAAIKLRGWTAPGYWSCDNYLWEFVRRTIFTATMYDSTTAGTWIANKAIGPGLSHQAPFEFEVILAFSTMTGATWQFLKAGRGTLALQGVEEHRPSDGYDCFGPTPNTIVYLATLIVDADYQISTDSSTWGSIKALFAK